jgi:HEAT repeat protein
MRKALTAVAVAILVAISEASQAASSFDDLVANLKSPNARTRLEAATALGKTRRAEAVTPLAAAIRSEPESKVRLEVVRALRDLRDLNAVPALVVAMSDVDADVREEALGTLVELHADRDRQGAVSKFLQIFSDEYDQPAPAPFTTVDASVYRAMAQALRDEKKEIREEAAFAIGILDGRSATSELVQALQDPEPAVRGAAATSIGKVGAAGDGQQLIPLLADENTNVRNRVLQAIGSLRVQQAGPALREMFEANRRKELAVRILDTLSKVADPAQVDLFREIVKDPDPEKKRLAIEGLGRISDASMLSAFKKDFQRERNDELRLAYSFALVRLGDHDFLDSIVLGLTSATAGKRCRGYLLEVGPSVLADVYPYLNDQDADIRSELCDIIGAMGDGASIAWLEPLVKDPSPKVADRANRAIERLRRHGAAEGRW